jgi:hypothetical protein
MSDGAAPSRPAPPLEEIQARARAGDPLALALWGARLLTGHAAPFAPEDGIGRLVEAAELGNAEACEALAAYTAEGRLRPQSWTQALDLLQRAAELGEPRARRQLALLVRDSDAAAEMRSPGAVPDIWARARAAVDVGSWLGSPTGRTISASPRILAFEGFLSPEVCDWLIERARGKLTPAKIYDQGGSGGLKASDERNNSNCILHPFEWDVVIALVRARIAAAAGTIPAHLEDVSVLHYEVGQRFVRHFDFLDPNVPGLAEVIARNGQRIATALVLLNEDFEGGETGFPQLGLMWKGRKGDAIFFWNIDACGEGDPRTMHAGRPPTSGQKWLLSQFIRDKAWPLAPALPPSA